MGVIHRGVVRAAMVGEVVVVGMYYHCYSLLEERDNDIGMTLVRDCDLLSMMKQYYQHHHHY